MIKPQTLGLYILLNTHFSNIFFALDFCYVLNVLKCVIIIVRL